MTSHGDNRTAEPAPVHPTVASGAQGDPVVDDKPKVWVSGELVYVMRMKPRARVTTANTTAAITMQHGHPPSSVLGTAAQKTAPVYTACAGALARAELKTPATLRELGLAHDARPSLVRLPSVVPERVSAHLSTVDRSHNGAAATAACDHFGRGTWLLSAPGLAPERYATLVTEVSLPALLVGGPVHEGAAVEAHAGILSTVICRRFHEHTGIEPVLAQETP